MSGLEKTIVAVAAAVAVVIINTLRENARVKKTLSQCVADTNAAENFGKRQIDRIANSRIAGDATCIGIEVG